MIELDNKAYLERFLADEGSISLTYGRMGQGKTTQLVRNVVRDLANGRRVFCNVPLFLDYYDSIFDDRKNFGSLLWRLVAFRKPYIELSRVNFKYINTWSDEVPNYYGVKELSRLTDCVVHLDEGQWIFDSYEKTDFSKAKRRLILHTRHDSREIRVYAQRPMSIQVTGRSQCNIFYKCSKIWTILFTVFKVEGFEDLDSGGNVIEDGESRTSVKFFLGRSSVWNLFDTHYLRTDKEIKYPAFKVYQYSYIERLQLLGDFLKGRLMALKRHKTSAPTGLPGDNSLFDSAIKSYNDVKSIGVKVSGKTIKKGVGSILKPSREVDSIMEKDMKDYLDGGKNGELPF